MNESFTNFVLLAGKYSPRLIAALVAGAIIGLEGEIYNRPAGLRTNILITLGATLLSIISLVAGQMFGGDPTRISAQIITGIGFIGAGVIMHHHEQIHGITTAALIFVTAAIGMTIGYGFIWSGIGIAIIVCLILVCLRPAGRAIENSKIIGRLRKWQPAMRDGLELLKSAQKKTPKKSVAKKRK